jgi:hypothetical protein
LKYLSSFICKEWVWLLLSFLTSRASNDLHSTWNTNFPMHSFHIVFKIYAVSLSYSQIYDMQFWSHMIKWLIHQRNLNNKNFKISCISVDVEKLSGTPSLLSVLFKSLCDWLSVSLPLILWKHASPKAG